MHGAILQFLLIIMDRIMYDSFIKSQPTSVRGCIQKGSL